MSVELDRVGNTPPWARVATLFVGLLIVSLLAYVLTGHVIPSSAPEALVYQNALLLLVLGSAIIEHRFTRPADSLVNSLMGFLTLIPVYGVAPRIAWYAMLIYSILVMIAATVCIAVSDSPHLGGARAIIARVTYNFSTFFGRARLFFSALLLFGIWSFYDRQDPRVAVLVTFWGGYLAIWPLNLPAVLGAFSLHSKDVLRPSGEILRTDWPNILRVRLNDAASWNPANPKLCRQQDGARGLVVPLYLEKQATQIIGTGLFVPSSLVTSPTLEPSVIYEPSPTLDVGQDTVATALGAEADSRMVGFVVEDSEIRSIRFETWDPSACREGAVVWTHSDAGRVYYQILNGTTREEASETNRRGYQVAIAAQLGRADRARGFVKYPWLPWMNSPVFSVPPTFGEDIFATQDNDFTLGVVPGTKIPVALSLRDAFAHHVAVLGVTGSGKTELAFDLIRHAVRQGVKVICVDLTARYTGRLADLSPRSLSIDDKLARELSEKLFAVETGQFKATEERKALEVFSGQLKKDIAGVIMNFLETNSGENRVGIVTLPEISNTKATLYITELYLSLLLRYAKNKGDASPPILIVLEEAHTVIPEASTMGLGDNESKGLVGKIAQIALQGRKYRVGLLVVAQRTATVSKTVLTQCNTIISFSCIDDTSLGFLSNVYGSTFSRQLPNLPPLHAVVFGKAVRSEHPLVVEIPYDARKATAA